MTARSQHTENSAFVRDGAPSSRGIITKGQRRSEEKDREKERKRLKTRRGTRVRWTEEGISRRCTERRATALKEEQEENKGREQR